MPSDDHKWSVDAVLGIKFEDGVIQYFCKYENQRIALLPRWSADTSSIPQRLLDMYAGTAQYLKYKYIVNAKKAKSEQEYDKEHYRCDDDEWEVEDIVGIRLLINNSIKVLIKWKGWTGHDSWSPIDDCRNADRTMRHFADALNGINEARRYLRKNFPHMLLNK